MKIRQENVQRFVFSLLGILIFLVIWHFAVALTDAKMTTPGPIEVLTLLFSSMVNPIGEYTVWGHLLISLQRVMIGFILATVSGILLGIGMGRNLIIRGVFKPIFEILRPIPPIAWIPIGILWFGIDESSKIFIIWIATFTIITLNAYTAAVNVDEQLIGVGKMLGASNFHIFWRIILPSCMPQIFAGLQTGISTSWCAVLAAEMVRSSSGCGWIIIRGNDTANIPQVMVGMIIIAIMGLVLSNSVRFCERKICSWNIVSR